MCNHAKSTSYQAERILFLSIMRIVAPSGLRLSSQLAHAPQADRPFSTSEKWPTSQEDRAWVISYL